MSRRICAIAEQGDESEVMRISIVTVSYNSKDTIADAMESVWRQKRCGFEVEYIVVDGGSTDGTVDVIRSFEQTHNLQLATRDFTFKWISERDKGLYDAMNKGVRMATGEVVGVLNSDDMMAADDVLEKVADVFAKKPELEFLCSDVRFIDREATLEGLRKTKTRRFICPIIWRPWMLTFGYAPPHPGMYIKKSCFEKWGYYKHEYRIGADYEMVVRFTRKHKAKRAYMRKCAVAMRLGGASTEKGNAGSFVGNNFDVVDANRENGYVGSRLLVLGKLPMKAMELIVPKIFPHIGS